ncbi:hypothetical protein [Natranaerobius trueperi]|uniref:Uncharacterized protein n=1 Tax=Natranaerobius trueperi TaxID=759412 RepID=A0A226C3J2_9FIRM|nr:hypothetical protein [Natranaerobius trueperi]OWZ84980.1 hypothetical protein CDO51_00835 [Natranaerobius trueperi]
MEKYEQSIETLSEYKDLNAKTFDGELIEVVGNIGNLVDVDTVIDIDGEELPTKEEQYKVYKNVLENG